VKQRIVAAVVRFCLWWTDYREIASPWKGTRTYREFKEQSKAKDATLAQLQSTLEKSLSEKRATKKTLTDKVRALEAEIKAEKEASSSLRDRLKKDYRDTQAAQQVMRDAHKNAQQASKEFAQREIWYRQQVLVRLDKILQIASSQNPDDQDLASLARQAHQDAFDMWAKESLPPAGIQ
jgi:gamma-glutamyl:cysteine ligase YbdK (ATP-grasp superfamily)